MQFGMPMLIEIRSIEETAALCRELGLKFIELNMNLPEYHSIHLDENLNPCDFNERVSAAYTETVMQTIAVAKRLNVLILKVHLTSGVYFTLPEKKAFLFEEYTDDYLKRLTAFRDVCTAAIGNANIEIRVASSFAKKGLTLLLESPAFGLTFDVGHNAAADYSDEPTIMENADRLMHFHIHDAKGRNPKAYRQSIGLAA